MARRSRLEPLPTCPRPHPLEPSGLGRAARMGIRDPQGATVPAWLVPSFMPASRPCQEQTQRSPACSAHRPCASPGDGSWRLQGETASTKEPMALAERRELQGNPGRGFLQKPHTSLNVRRDCFENENRSRELLAERVWGKAAKFQASAPCPNLKAANAIWKRFRSCLFSATGNKKTKSIQGLDQNL